jgi:thiamine biosynthesis protein ThiI
MDNLYLIKIGEIQLKDGNRQAFMDCLKRDLKRRLSGYPNTLEVRQGRLYLHIGSTDAAKAEAVLGRTPGINGWARALRTGKTVEAIVSAATTCLRESLARGARTFKIESRRADKSFPLESYDISREVGGRLLESCPQSSVDVHHPDTVISIEIREHAYIYNNGEPGLRGLPSGSAGRGLLMLSGGIDSPVAGFRMLTRGLTLESLHFHAYPYTSREAWEKVRSLATILASYAGGMTLHSLHFTEIQLKLKKDAPADRTTLYLRACMMLAADLLCSRRGLKAIVTGESLGQVASQTAENMRFTQSWSNLPVFRPLIGMDKEEIILTARRIGSYELSILPYQDCCVLFAAKHPLLKADFIAERLAFEQLGMQSMINAAVDTVETIKLPC